MSDNLSVTRKKLIQQLLEDEEDEEDDDDIMMLLSMPPEKRMKIDSIFTSRKVEGCFQMLIKRHLNYKAEKFRKYCRLNHKQFDFVLSLINQEIKPRRNGTTIITSAEKLFLTLRFIATGESYASLEYTYRISASYISRIVKDVLKSLRKNLVPILLPAPTEDYLKHVTNEFWNRWNFPNCFGAIDGKHVRIKAPNNSGSLFFNYKEYYSLVLLAVVDANYKFIAVDVGSYGKEGDSGIFQKSSIGKKIARNQFNAPKPTNLHGTDIVLPHFLVGDEAFALDTYMMKPYCRNDARVNRDKAIFNYRLCRARRVTENSFALLSQVFRIFYTPISIRPEVSDDLILTACCLHNLLRDGYLERNGLPYYKYDPKIVLPRENMIPLRRAGGFTNLASFEIRDSLTSFFSSPAGQVPWQENRVNRIE